MYLKLIFTLIVIHLRLTVSGQTLDPTNSNWLYEPPSGPDNYLIFSPTNVIYSLDFLNYYEGTWEIINDTIYLDFEFYKGLRGVGNIDPVSSMDSPSYLREIPTINQIDNSAKIYINRENMIDLYWSGDKSSYQFHRVKTSKFSVEKLNISINGDYPELSIRIIPIDQLKTYSKKDLRLMRNEIFARYGYVFQSTDLNNHFKSKNWYQPAPDVNSVVDGYLTDIEKHNIMTIKSLE